MTKIYLKVDLADVYVHIEWKMTIKMNKNLSSYSREVFRVALAPAL